MNLRNTFLNSLFYQCNMDSILHVTNKLFAMENPSTNQPNDLTGATILHTLSSFCLDWCYDDFEAIFRNSEKGTAYYWNLFEKIRLTFKNHGSDMLAFIYELEDEDKNFLFHALFPEKPAG